MNAKKITYKRKQYVNIYLGIAAIGAVFTGIKQMNHLPTDGVGSFVFAMFFVAAGFDYRERLKDKISVMKEMCLAAVIYIVSALMAICVDFVDSGSVRDRVLKCVTFNGVTGNWIIPAIILAVLLYESVRKKFSIKTAGIISVIIIVMSFFAEQIAIPTYCHILVRGLVGYVFICAGEISHIIYEKSTKKKSLLIIFSFVIASGGILISYFNSISFENIIFGNAALFYISSGLTSIGLMWITKWFEYNHPLELLGDSYLVLLGSYYQFGVLYFTMMFDKAIFKLTDHAFISRTSSLMVLFGSEIIIIFIYRKIRKALGYDSGSISESGD